MRRRIQDLHLQAKQSSFPLSRLFSMCVMLVIVTLVFVRMGNSDNWRWVGARSVKHELVIGKNGLPESATEETKPVDQGIGGSSSAAQPPAASPATSTAAPAASDSSAAKPALPKTTDQVSSLHQPFVPSSGSGSAVQPVDVGNTKMSTNPSLPPATGATDEDAEERDYMEEARLAVKDGRLNSTNVEMAAYQHVMDWVEHQPLERMIARAKKHVLYDRFLSDPDSLRFKLIDVTLNVRQIIEEPYKTLNGNVFYELRGFAPESGQLLYMAMVTGLPKGMPIGVDINEQVRLVGYFYKKQAYFSQASLAHAKRLECPLIVGRIVWKPDTDDAFNTSFPPWLVGAAAAVGCVVVAGWVFFARRITQPLTLPPLRISHRTENEGPSVDDWLDQAQAGELSKEGMPPRETESREKPANGHSNRGFGNIFESEGESNSGH